MNFIIIYMSGKYIRLVYRQKCLNFSRHQNGEYNDEAS